MSVPGSLTQQDGHTQRATDAHDKWLIAIGAFKLLEALLFILLGIGAVKLLHKDLVDVVTHFIISIGRDPEGHFVNLLLDKVAMIDPHRLKQISVAIFAYAALHMTEGIGLVLQKAWAEYFTLILTASFLPWEFFEIIRHVTWMKIGVTVLNVLVLLYLIYVVQLRIRERRQRALG